MGIVQDLAQFEFQLGELIKKYEQYFLGLEKREPLQLLSDVEKSVRLYAGIPINNTMYKHKYTMLVARFNTYREHWKRTVRLIEEGKYSRDRFICQLREGQRPWLSSTDTVPARQTDLDRLYEELRTARRACNLPVDTLTREMVAAVIEKNRPGLAARLGTDNLAFRVVVEDGRPRIKARKK